MTFFTFKEWLQKVILVVFFLFKRMLLSWMNYEFCSEWLIGKRWQGSTTLLVTQSVSYFKFPDSCAEERNRALSALTSTEHTPVDQRKSSLAFKDISANTIAEQLTYLEYRMLRRIPVSACFNSLLLVSFNTLCGLLLQFNTCHW